jgi:CRISPR-associated endonuclease Csn1
MISTIQSSTIWAFDLGKASIGEAVRNLGDNTFPHVESLLIPAELARRGPATVSGSPANKYRALKTREAHRARERWLETVWTAAGLTPLRGRQVGKVDGNWKQVADADPRLEREFAAKGDNTCYTSCLLRIRLLQGDDSLAEWQIYKALRSALQRRGYGPVPWAAKEAVRSSGKTKEDEAQDLEREARWKKFKRGFKQSEDESLDPQRRPIAFEYQLPCYYDAFQMELWNPTEPNKLTTQIKHTAGSTRNVRFDRADVRRELIKLGDEAARILPAVRDAFSRWQRDGWTYTHPVTGTALTYPVQPKTFGEFLCDGPAGTPDETDFKTFLDQRSNAGLRRGTFEEWMAALGQKTPKFDNRILNDCVLIPRFHVCKVDVRLDTQTGQPVPESLLATEVTFLLKLKNLLVADAEKGQRKLTPKEVRSIFAYAHQQLKAAKLARNWPGKVADCFALTKSEWGKKNGLAELELRPLPGHEEVKAPKVSGRCAYSRVALRILKELILSGEAPSAFHARLCRREEDLLRKLGSTPEKPLVLVADATATAEDERKRENTENQKLGVLFGELNFLLQMRSDDAKADSWDNLFVPSQTLDALKGRHTEDRKLDCEAAILDLLGTINDPIVRHRLGVFAERLKKLQLGDAKDGLTGFGVPDSVVLEFVREDFMGDEAKRQLFSFQKRREEDRKEGKEMASAAGATSRLSSLKYQLWKAQGGECLYGKEVFNESGGSKATCLYREMALPLTRLDDYVIDHIVPRAQGGPDAMVNYVLTTRDTNEAKGDRTPFEWLHSLPGFDWDAYVKRVNNRTTTLRNKKVQLLTREDARDLVSRYTALAETAWVSKLAQTIVNLRFGWENGCEEVSGKKIKRVIVVSGGLTARVRRKYGLDRLLYSDVTDPEILEKKTKNRDDDRHHALDAMVLTFIPQWARDEHKEGFFKLPDGVHREYFGSYIASVVPRFLIFEKAKLADTIYGKERMATGRITQRVELRSLAYKPIAPGKSRFDLDYARKQIQSVRDAHLRKSLETLVMSEPDAATWEENCKDFPIVSNKGVPGSKVVNVNVTVGKADEFADLSKDGKGAWRKAKQGHQGQVVFLDKLGKPRVRPIYVFESVHAVKKRIAEEGGVFYGLFRTGCLVSIDKPIIHQTTPLEPGVYRLNSIESVGRAKVTSTAGVKSLPIAIEKFIEANLKPLHALETLQALAERKAQKQKLKR